MVARFLMYVSFVMLLLTIYLPIIGMFCTLPIDVDVLNLHLLILCIFVGFPALFGILIGVKKNG